MGNKTSKASKKSTKKACCLWCMCISSKSSASKSVEEQQLPTFDRIASNEKRLNSSLIETSPSSNIMIRNRSERNISVTNNRRSLSLNNVILTLADDSNERQEKNSNFAKPPLPPGKSVTVSILPPAGRSFRGTLINTKRTYYSQSIEHARSSIEDLEKSLHGASSIDQWIDSLPMLGTPSLNRNKPIRTVASTNNKKIKRSLTIGDEYSENVLNGSYRQKNDATPDGQEHKSTRDDFPNILTLKYNREFLNLAKRLKLNIHLKDFQLRINNTKSKQTFKSHFSLSTVIYPLAGIDQVLADGLALYFITPLESILPSLSSNANSTYKIYEQIRSKSYFIPVKDCKIEIDDDEYKKKSVELDRTHVVITLENKVKEHDEPMSSKKLPIEQEPSCLFISDDSFQTGQLRIDQEKVAKHFLPFTYHSSEDNLYYLSSTLIQHWFNTLILVNQTCAIAQRFLKGDGSHITCLIKQQTNHAKVSSLENNLTFAALRLPLCMYLNDSSQTNIDDEEKPNIIDAFSSMFLSDNQKAASDTIHIDYEQYSFALLLNRWPKSLLDNYYTQSTRNSKRKWPSKYHLNIVIKKPLLLIPSQNDHKWEINFDLIEQSLFELMNESTLYFYTLCQQLFCQTLTVRSCLKHCFLNYCEKYGLPFSPNHESSTNNIFDLMTHFLQDIQIQINEKFIPNHFNPNINLYEPTEEFIQWSDHMNKCLNDRTYIQSSLLSTSNRAIIVEFLFHFIDQLYQTFHIKRSQFHLNESVLIDLHKQLCEKLSNDTNNNSTALQKFINHLLNNQQILEHIQMSLTYDFETNAELVHTCLNQVRKADSSLIFHYTWTIYIQYLHTYYNVLWNT